MFYIWKRNDGRYGASVYIPKDWTGADGSVTTFEVLGGFNTWAEAEQFINTNNLTQLQRN